MSDVSNLEITLVDGIVSQTRVDPDIVGKSCGEDSLFVFKYFIYVFCVTGAHTHREIRPRQTGAESTLVLDCFQCE